MTYPVTTKQWSSPATAITGDNNLWHLPFSNNLDFTISPGFFTQSLFSLFSHDLALVSFYLNLALNSLKVSWPSTPPFFLFELCDYSMLPCKEILCVCPPCFCNIIHHIYLTDFCWSPWSAIDNTVFNHLDIHILPSWVQHHTLYHRSDEYKIPKSLSIRRKLRYNSLLFVLFSNQKWCFISLIKAFILVTKTSSDFWDKTPILIGE